MVSKIRDHLYLGDWQDAQKFDGDIICVTQEIMSIEPMNAYWIPIIRTSKPTNDDELIEEQDIEVTALKHQLELVVQTISNGLERNRDVLVHCMAGIERSPLAIVFYLHGYVFTDKTWEECYDFVKSKRPEVQNRLEWLNMSFNERMS